ncbi:MAG: tRNA (N6-isopentenyl adenosine(37)-C2)-methylthiotransferase MiaB [Candidatus Omnitrophica bacterium]|nr:tRNA (N6-isopentenyl adenosine(37)-C2)-methylthiotransferase MiaB [Candidatus Omnitrophota bacterium]
MKEDKKKVFIRTMGCQMNVRDSEVIGWLLHKAGFKLTDNPDKADVIILNTCSVRQHAEDKVWSEVGRFKKQGLSSKRAAPIIGIVGCMAQNYKEHIFEKSQSVNFAVGPQDIDKIPDIVNTLVKDKGLFERKIWETDGLIRPEEVYHTGFYEDKDHAYVVISEGCENFCSYCVVPFVRGKLRHRGHKEIIKEIKNAIKKGITRITLLGQNVNAYQSAIAGRKAPAGFIELLKMVNAIKGLKEFSFVTSHPKDASVSLFKAMNELGKLKKYLHLPVQSGSTRILKLMNRNYKPETYLQLAEDYRKIVKNGVLTTDIIVGFPTETNEDFQETYDLVKKVRFNAAFIFKYSVRPHTEASKLVDDVPKEVKQRRHGLVLELQKKISREKSNEK